MAERHRLFLFGLVAGLAIACGACRSQTEASHESPRDAGAPARKPVPAGVDDPCRSVRVLSEPPHVVCYIDVPIDDGVAAVLSARSDRAGVTLYFKRTDRELLASVSRVPWARKVTISPDPGSTSPPADLRALAPLVDLRELYVGNGARVREVEDAWGFEKLEALTAYEEGVVDLRGVKALRNLRKLTVGKEIADIGPLAELTQLEQLVLPGTQRDLGPIGSLSRLSVLSVVADPTTNLDPLGRLTSLRELSIRGAPPDALARALASLPAFTRLFVNGDERLTDVRPFATIERLELLDLGKTRVKSIAPLKALPRLKTLKLWDTPVSDLHELPAFPALEMVLLPGDTPEATRKELARKMPRVRF